MGSFLALIGVLFGTIVALFIKKRSAEALLENNEVKSKLNEQDKIISKNEGLLLSEEEKRASLNTNGNGRKDEPVKPDDF